MGSKGLKRTTKGSTDGVNTGCILATWCPLSLSSGSSSLFHPPFSDHLLSEEPTPSSRQACLTQTCQWEVFLNPLPSTGTGKQQACGPSFSRPRKSWDLCESSYRQLFFSAGLNLEVCEASLQQVSLAENRASVEQDVGR